MARSGPAGSVTSFTASGELAGVAATSARNAWAVGSADSGRTLIARWNGRAWKQVPGPRGRLSAVAATSARSAWAVGYITTKTSVKTLAERWNGRVWKRVPSPTPGGGTSSTALPPSPRTGPGWSARPAAATAPRKP